MDNRKYDVVVIDSMEIIGYTFGPSWGGLVYSDDEENVVGQIARHPEDERYVAHLRANLQHHTGKKRDGVPIAIANRPRK